MTDLTLLKKEIRFRSSRRGVKELDIVLGGFVEKYIEQLSTDELAELKTFLLNFEPDLLAWIVDEQTPPEVINTPLYAKIMFYKHHELRGK